MACGDVLSLEDLQTAKKHQIFEAEVITGKAGGVAGGVAIDYATNQVTGQVQKTMPAILRDIGFEPAPFDFATGGALTTADRNKAVLWPPPGGDGDWYYWEGALPKIIPAASTPASTGGVTDGAWRPVGDITLRGDLAAPGGAALIGGVSQLFNVVADMTAFPVVVGRLYQTLGHSAVNDKGGAHYLAMPSGTAHNLYGDPVASNGVVLLLAETIISPSMFGAKNDGADYKLQIEACINDGRDVEFTSSHTASTVRYGRHGATIHQNGFTITGMAAALTDSVLEITSRYSTIYGIKANGNFKPYNQAIRWHSLDVNDPSNNTIIFGMEVLNTQNGLVYGNRPGLPVVDAPHSENALYGFRSRGVKVPFVGNQPNGALSVFSPIFDCNPYEQSTQPGYDATEWGTNSMAFLNDKNNALSIHGGEILKTFSNLGVGWQGGNVSIHGAVNEVACTRARVTWDVNIYGEIGGFMASDSAPIYVCGVGESGVVTIHGGSCYRAPGVADYSGADMISNNGAFIFRMNDCKYSEWKPTKVGDNTADLSNVIFAWIQGATPVKVTASTTKSTRATIATSGAWVGVNLSETLLSTGQVSLAGSVKSGAAGVVGTVKNPPPVNSVFLVPTFNSGLGTYGTAIFSIAPDGTMTSNTATVELLLAGVSYLV